MLGDCYAGRWNELRHLRDAGGVDPCLGVSAPERRWDAGRGVSESDMGRWVEGRGDEGGRS